MNAESLVGMIHSGQTVAIRSGVLERVVIEAWVNRTSGRVMVKYADGEEESIPAHSLITLADNPDPSAKSDGS